MIVNLSYICDLFIYLFIYLTLTNLKLVKLHIFFPTLKNLIITTTHYENKILDGDEFYVLEVHMIRLFMMRGCDNIIFQSWGK